VVVTVGDYLREAWEVRSSPVAGFTTSTTRWRLVVSYIAFTQVNQASPKPEKIIRSVSI
jgi:hypothetical protein